MASRVNTKFVVGLVAGLLAILVVVVFVGYNAVKKSGASLMAEGDKFMAEKDYDKAIRAYGRAVNKDQRNIPWIHKWMDAIEISIPPTQQAYQDRYFKEYRAGLRALADADRNNLAPFRRLLDEQMLLTKLSGSSAPAWKQLSDTTEDMLKIWRGDEKGKNILRRYRGLAALGAAIRNPELRDDQIQSGCDDLSAALEADPADQEVIIGLTTYDDLFNRAAVRRSAEEEGKARVKAGRDRLAQFIEKNPGANYAAFRLLFLDLNANKQQFDADMKGKTITKEIAERFEASQRKQLEEGMTRIIQALRESKDAAVDPFSTADIAAMAVGVFPKGMGNQTSGMALGLDILDRVREARPKDTGMILMLEARIARSQATEANGFADLDTAEQFYKKVIALPPMPLSLQGLWLRQYRAEAISSLCSISYQRWEQAKTSADKDAATARVQELRKQLVDMVGENADSVLAVDAMSQMMKGDFMGARSLATRYNDHTNRSDEQMLQIEADILTRTQSTGAAKEIYAGILQRNPGDLKTIIRLGAIEAGAGNFCEAARLYAKAIESNRDNPQLNEMYRTAAEACKGQSSDPVTRTLQEANGLATGIARDLPGAIQKLRDGLQQNDHDPRLTLALAQALFQNKDPAGARQEVQNLQKYLEDYKPTSEYLDTVKKVRKALDNPDRTAASLQAIDESPTPDWQKNLARFEAYMQAAVAAGSRQQAAATRNDQPEADKAAAEVAALQVKARDELKKAMAVRPDDPTVAEVAFTDAVNRFTVAKTAQNNAKYRADKAAAAQADAAAKGDTAAAAKFADQARDAKAESEKPAPAIKEASDEMERLALLAESKNLDQVGGLLFRARVQLMNGSYEDAKRSLREVTSKDKFSTVGWRLLGMVLLQAGEGQAAADALAKAVEITPSDIVSSKAYIRALVASKRYTDALTFARRVEPNFGGDAEFAEMLLQLESSNIANADPVRAIAIRNRLMASDPDNQSNQFQLCLLLIGQKRYPEAQKLISEIRQKDPMNAYGVALDAKLRGDQGDQKGALQVYFDYIKAIPEDKRTQMPYIEAARTVADLGMIDAAVNLLETGRKYQDGKYQPIDRELGDLLFKVRQYDKSIQAYRRLVEAGNTDQKVRNRIIESLINSGQFVEADKEIASLGDAGKTDATVQLLAAESAVQQANAATDRTVVQQQRDRARRIYDQLIALDSKNWLGFLKRGDFNRNDLAMYREVEQDYLQVLQIDSSINMARARLAGLYQELGRPDQAIDQFRAAIQTDPSDDQLRDAYIDLLYQRKRVIEAANAIEEIVKLRPTDPQWLYKGGKLALRAERFDRAAEYFGVLWKQNPAPEIAQLYVSALLSKNPPDLNTATQVLATPALKTDQSIQLCLVRSRLYRTRKQFKEANDQVITALGLVDQSKRDQAGAFVSGLGGPEGVYPIEAEMVNALARLEEKAPFKEWLAYFAARVRMKDPAKIPDVRAVVKAVAGTTQDNQLKASACGLLGNLEYGDQQWDAAADYYKQGMDADPKNPELLNNWAYLAATKLKKPKDALEAAEKAVKLSPETPNYLDTLASAYILTQNYDKAAAYLGQAISLARTDDERGPILLHMAQARLGQGNRPEAKRLLDLCEQVFQNTDARPNYDADLKALQKAIDAR